MSDMEGELLFGRTLEVNAAGLINGLRKANDGVALFGVKSADRNQELDFFLNIKSKYSSSLLFMIYYRKENRGFYLRAHNDGSDVPPSILVLVRLHV